MKHLLILLVMLVGCGGGYIDGELLDSITAIEPGRYKIVLEFTEGTCNFFQEREEGTWQVHQKEDGEYMLNVKGLWLRSDDGMTFYGGKQLSDGVCPTNVFATAAVTKTSFGFIGDVRLSVDLGICGSCVDYGDITATRVVSE